MIFADKDQLVEALSNILKSVIELNDLHNCVIPFSIESKRDKIMVHITFDSTSWNKSLTEYLKLPSYRIDKWMDTKKGNEGIGLAISKAIIERHHGKIDVKTQKKQTRIELNIPFNTTLQP